ncbi:hypothetical protein D3C86_1572740 [compost metagenome]
MGSNQLLGQLDICFSRSEPLCTGLGSVTFNERKELNPCLFANTSILAAHTDLFINFSTLAFHHTFGVFLHFLHIASESCFALGNSFAVDELLHDQKLIQHGLDALVGTIALAVSANSLENKEDFFNLCGVSEFVDCLCGFENRLIELL